MAGNMDATAFYSQKALPKSKSGVPDKARWMPMLTDRTSAIIGQIIVGASTFETNLVVLTKEIAPPEMSLIGIERMPFNKKRRAFRDAASARFSNTPTLVERLHAISQDIVAPFKTRNFVAHGEYTFELGPNGLVIHIHNDGEQLTLSEDDLSHCNAGIARANAALMLILANDLSSLGLTEAESQCLADTLNNDRRRAASPRRGKGHPQFYGTLAM